ncbi:MAG: GyrI-like domain-containing protein [Bacillus sp. (in: firmicutes)]
MDYEIIDLEEKLVAGLKIRMNNNRPTMGKEIGDLWKGFFEQGVYQSIPHKRNEKTIGLYTNYESDVNGDYDMMVCTEVQHTSDIPPSLQQHIISAGKYAKFIVIGDMQAVGAFWQKLWKMDLNRKYASDFEEYQSGSDGENAEIHIYISLNERERQ